MKSGTRARIGAAGIAATALVLVPGTAHATSSSGVSATILARRVEDGKDYILREITIQPGGSTGWHYHDGTLYAFVKNGVLTHTDADCTTTQTYRRHDTFREPSGITNIHLGRNLGTAPVTLDVLYVDPAGSPLSEDAPNPGCAFQ
jgi:quercetin dioxygenase-like cupin family protein